MGLQDRDYVRERKLAYGAKGWRRQSWRRPPIWMIVLLVIAILYAVAWFAY